MKVSLIGTYDGAGAGGWHVLSEGESLAGPFSTELRALKEQDRLEGHEPRAHTPRLVRCATWSEAQRLIASGANVITAARDRGRSADRVAR